MASQVFSQRYSDCRIVSNESDSSIAKVAQETPNLVRLMVVVDSEASTNMIHASTDGADSMLGLEHFFVSLNCDPVSCKKTSSKRSPLHTIRVAFRPLLVLRQHTTSIFRVGCVSLSRAREYPFAKTRIRAIPLASLLVCARFAVAVQTTGARTALEKVKSRIVLRLFAAWTVFHRTYMIPVPKIRAVTG